MRKLLIVGLSLLGNCAANGGERDMLPIAETSVSICSILSNARVYDGKEVLANAIYRFEPHGAILLGESCPDEEVKLSFRPDYIEEPHAAIILDTLKGKDQFKPAMVQLRGVFHVAHTGQCFGEFCDGYLMQASHLLAAARVR